MKICKNFIYFICEKLYTKKKKLGDLDESE